jgi:hypothetical protein
VGISAQLGGAWRQGAMGNESQAGKEEPESQEEGHIDGAKCHVAQWLRGRDSREEVARFESRLPSGNPSHM